MDHQQRAVSTHRGDASASSLSEAKGAHTETLGDLVQAGVVSDGADNSGDLALLRVVDDAGQRHRGSVGARLVQAAQDGFIESGASTAGQEAVQLRDTE